MTFKIAFKVKFKANKMKPIYDFLLMLNCNYLPNLHCFKVIAIRRCTNGHLTLKIALKVKFKANRMNPICGLPRQNQAKVANYNSALEAKNNV